MKSIGLLYIVFVVTFGFAQPPDTLWTKTYGGTENDVGNSIKQTSDGGYIIAGYTESFGTGQQDVWLLKTDANGDTVWTKTYGGAYNDWAEDVQQTTEGGYIIAANTESFAVDGSAIWLIKTNSLGDTAWTKIHGSSFGEQCHAVQQTSDGGYIIAGRFAFMQWHPLMLKTDANGDTAWVIMWQDQGGMLSALCKTDDSTFVAAGSTGFAPVWIPWLFKFSANGDTIWNKTFGVAYLGGGFSSVKEVPVIGYVACGSSYTNGILRLYIAKVNPQGDTLWIREYGDSLFQRGGNSVLLTYGNDYVCTGVCGEDPYTDTDLFLFKIDENGDSLWCVIYGDSDYPDCGNEVLQTNDGGYIVVGHTESYGAGGSDVWLIKTEPDVGVEENEPYVVTSKGITSAIFSGPLLLPEGKKCRVFDITGRVVAPDKISPGVYFIEIDKQITQKVIKIK